MRDLNRLSDRIEGDVVVKRYGMWGTTSEVEKRGRKFIVVHPNGKQREFKRKIDAQEYLDNMVRHEFGNE